MVMPNHQSSHPPGVPEHYQMIRATGNGSCGPNALSIIFSSLLLVDAYRDFAVDLTEFAMVWNLFYVDDPIGFPDCGGADHNQAHRQFVADSIAHSEEQAAYKNYKSELAECVKQKVLNRLHLNQGGSFKDIEKLLSPLLRFKHVLGQKIDEHLKKLRSSKADTPNTAAVKSYRDSFNQTSINHLRFLMTVASDYPSLLSRCADSARHDMSRFVRSKAYSLGDSYDNSPDFRTFFDQLAMASSAELLRLNVRFAYAHIFDQDLVINRDGQRISTGADLSNSIYDTYQEQYPHLQPCQLIDHIVQIQSSHHPYVHCHPVDQQDVRTLFEETVDDVTRPCVFFVSVINWNWLHFDPTIAVSLETYATENRKTDFLSLLNNHRSHQSYDKRSDDDVYNILKVPGPVCDSYQSSNVICSSPTKRHFFAKLPILDWFSRLKNITPDFPDLSYYSSVFFQSLALIGVMCGFVVLPPGLSLVLGLTIVIISVTYSHLETIPFLSRFISHFRPNHLMHSLQNALMKRFPNLSSWHWSMKSVLMTGLLSIFYISPSYFLCQVLMSLLSGVLAATTILSLRQKKWSIVFHGARDAATVKSSSLSHAQLKSEVSDKKQLSSIQNDSLLSTWFATLRKSWF